MENRKSVIKIQDREGGKRVEQLQIIMPLERMRSSVLDRVFCFKFLDVLAGDVFFCIAPAISVSVGLGVICHFSEKSTTQSI